MLKLSYANNSYLKVLPAASPAVFLVLCSMVWSVVGGVTSPPAVFPVPRPLFWLVVGGVTSPPANELAASSEERTLTSDLCKVMGLL